MSLLELRGVGLANADGPLLEGIDLRLDEGQALIVTGPPGSGRTSLLEITAGFRQPTRGMAAPAATFGWLPQHGALVSNLTLWDNVALPLRWHLGADEAGVTRGIQAVCDALECDLPPKAPAATASPEHRAVAGVARALALVPSVLIADCPGEDLAAAVREDLWRMLWRIQAAWGTAILASTGDAEAANPLTERVLTLPPRRTVAFRLRTGILG